MGLPFTTTKKKTLTDVLGSFAKLKTDLTEFSEQNNTEMDELQKELEVKRAEQKRVDKINQNISQLLDP